MAPALSRFVRQDLEVDVQPHLTDQPVHIVEKGFDREMRVGELPDARLNARLLAHNQRALLAAPAYLRRAGTPTASREFSRHACLFIRETGETFGTWHLRQGTRSETVKVRGPLASNDGESVLGWALEGHGVVMRSLWEAALLVRAGQLVRVLPEWQLPAADVHAVFPTRSHRSAKTRALIDASLVAFEAHRQSAEGAW